MDEIFLSSIPRYKLSLTPNNIFLICTFLLQFIYAQPKIDNFHPNLIFDFNSMNEDEKSIIIKALAKLKMNRTIEVKEGESIDKIIRKNYLPTLTSQKVVKNKTWNTLVDILIENNSIADPNKIFTDQKLMIPVLPDFKTKDDDKPKDVLDVSEGNIRIVQFIDVMAKKKSISSMVDYFKSENNIDEPNNVANNSNRSSDVDLTILNMETKEMKLFLENLPENILSKISITPDPHDIVEIKLNDVQNDSSLAMNNYVLTQDLKEKLKSLDVTIAGKFYILDQFNYGSECSHGKKVLDVVKSILDSCGAPQLKANVIPLEIDFSKNIREAKYECRKYLKECTQLNEDEVNAYLKIMEENYKPSSKGIVIPAIYLLSVLGNVINDPDASVITCSFWTSSSIFRVFPHQLRSRKDLVLICAVLDIGTIENSPFVEPLTSFSESYAKFPFVLVGARLKPGLSGGMYSITGEGVSTIDNGFGWSGSCINPRDVGTSFSTPAIGTKLFVAKNYWRSNNYNPEGIEARERLLLSSEIDSNSLGKYASAGIPNLYNLLKIKGVFVRSASDNELNSVDSISGYVRFKKKGEKNYQRIEFGKSNYECCGFYIVDNKIALFRKNGIKWEEGDLDIQDPLNLVIKKGNIITNYTTPQKFLEQFKELLIL